MNYYSLSTNEVFSDAYDSIHAILDSFKVSLFKIKFVNDKQQHQLIFNVILHFLESHIFHY